MRFLRRTGEALEFELAPREAEALVFVLGRYPVLEPGYHQVARPGGEAMVDEQQLLVELLAEGQAGNRRRVGEFLAKRLPRTTASGSSAKRAAIRLSLTAEDADWLLEILNDVRVGAWVRLGRPGSGQAKVPPVGTPALADFAAMEVAGHIQMVLLGALNS